MLNYPLSLYRGDSYHWQFRVWADRQKTIPFDLSGMTAAAEIRGVASEPATVLPCVITGSVIDVTLDASGSRTVPTIGWFDVQITNAAGAVQTLVSGSVAVQGDITGSVVAHG